MPLKKSSTDTEETDMAENTEAENAEAENTEAENTQAKPQAKPQAKKKPKKVGYMAQEGFMRNPHTDETYRQGQITEGEPVEPESWLDLQIRAGLIKVIEYS